MHSLNQYLEKKQIGYDRFFRIFLVVQFGIILFIYLFVFFSLKQSTEKNLLDLFRIMTISLFLGIVFGLVIGIFLLLRPYMAKNWDIHEVAPPFLLKLLLIFIISSTSSFYLFPIGFQAPLFNIGTIFGGIFSISAYNSEIKKEHLLSE